MKVMDSSKQAMFSGVAATLYLYVGSPYIFSGFDFTGMTSVKRQGKILCQWLILGEHLRHIRTVSVSPEKNLLFSLVSFLEPA